MLKYIVLDLLDRQEKKVLEKKNKIEQKLKKGGYLNLLSELKEHLKLMPQQTNNANDDLLLFYNYN
jgi:hypothetical protein